MFAHRTSKNAQPYSKETQDLLKLMMKESRLTNLQQRKIDQELKRSGQLPTGENAPKQYVSNRSGASANQASFGVNDRQFRNNKRINSLMAGSSISGHQLRRQEAIAKSGAYDVERYRGRALPQSGDSKKEELSNLMAYGVKKVAPPPTRKTAQEEEAPQESYYDSLLKRFQYLEAEVDDRHQFLQDIAGLPNYPQEAATIKTQVAFIKKEMTELDQKMREIEDASAEAYRPTLTF